MEHHGEKAIRHALGGGDKGPKHKTHTHSVHYERASNGGFIAHVHKHHGEGPHSEGHSHTEEHALPDKDAAAEHLEEHMGDQPGYGEEMPAPPAEEAEPAPAAGQTAGV